MLRAHMGGRDLSLEARLDIMSPLQQLGAQDRQTRKSLRCPLNPPKNPRRNINSQEPPGKKKFA